MNLMEYKGYRARIEYEHEDQIFHGTVVNILDTISFVGSSIDELNRAFHESIDDYIAFCEERGDQPEKPYSGKFQLRIPSHLHASVALAAKAKGMSINAYITECLHDVLDFEYDRWLGNKQWQTVSSPGNFQIAVPCAKRQQLSQGSYKTTRTERRNDGPFALAA